MTTFMSSDQQINNTNTLYISQLIAKNDKKQTRATLFQSNIQHEQTQKSQQHKQQTQKLKPLHLELSQTQRINTILTIGQVSYEEEVVATPKYKKSQKSRMQKLQQFQQNMNQILDDLDDRIVQLTIEIQ
ncbi:hypothetical protein SS50377_21128 [Spironucleus salmonicida]|uniref:Uncharacterized protein n=1 Tax=Spironucleus salmonicida TaxID=348837 RepID=A0A9P8S1Z5_9EUKA|nr:hypothetical protein SS50377_21128 [Spironucleus salmonicida]